MGVHRHRPAPRLPLPATVLEGADQLLLLRIHAEHRLPAVLMLADPVVDAAELGTVVGMLLALQNLGVALQAEALLAQQIAHRVRADPVSLPGQFGSELAGGLARPAQRRHGIPTHIRLDQRQQRIPRAGSRSTRSLMPPPARRTRPSGPWPESSSRTPSDTVLSRTPTARATSLIPPCPSDRASAPINRRRCRSSK